MKMGRIASLTLLLVVSLLLPSPGQARVVDGIDYRTGDVVFQQIGGDLGRLVQGITRSPFDHCGIIIVNKNGSVDVLEAIGASTWTMRVLIVPS